LELRCGIHHDLLKVESRWNYRKIRLKIYDFSKSQILLSGVWNYRLISGSILVKRLAHSVCGILEYFLSLESRRHFYHLRSYQKRCPFQLALSALFWGTQKTYSGTITGTLISFFGVEKFIANFIFFDLDFSVGTLDFMVN
jgi:hypothetical protein